MSNRAQSAVWEFAPVSGSELLTLVALADIADDDGVAYPSYAHLAKKTRLSERQIKRIVKSLLDQALVTLDAQGGKVDGKNVANRYKIDVADLIGRGVMASQNGGDKMTPQMELGVSPGAVGGDIAMAQEPSKNPHRDSDESLSKREKPDWLSNQAIGAVFAEWVSVADPARKNLSTSRERAVVKLLNETQDVDFAKKAVRGYVARRKSMGKSFDISDLVAVGPHTGSLGSRVDHFAEFDSPTADGSTPRVPHGTTDIMRPILRALLGELDEAERTGNEEWMERSLHNVPDGYRVIKDDGRWKVVRA